MEDNQYALVIGVSSRSALLPGAIADAHELASLLRGEVPGVDGRWIVTLRADGPDDNVQSNARSLAALLPNWLSTVPEDRDLLVYFAGHATVDLDEVGHETGVSLKGSDGPWISIATLAELIAKKRSRTATIILDCCYGGEIRKHFTSSLDGFSVFAAASEDQKANSWGSSYGFFSKMITSALSGGIRGAVTTQELDEYIVDEWKQLPRGVTDKQRPFTARSGVSTLLVTVQPETAGIESASDAISSLRAELVAKQVDNELSLRWSQLEGAAELPWRTLCLRSGEHALAVARAEPNDAYVAVRGDEGFRILRLLAKGGVRQARLDIERAVSARFEDGTAYGTLTVTTADGVQQAIQVWNLAFENVSSHG